VMRGRGWDTIKWRRIANQRVINGEGCDSSVCGSSPLDCCGTDLGMEIDNWWVEEGRGKIPCFVCRYAGVIHPQDIMGREGICEY